MARWRTHNKRARRKRERDGRLMRDIDKAIAALAATENPFKRIADQFARALNQLALAMRSAIGEASRQTSGSWLPLDPKYAGVRRPFQQREVWPDIVLEDILDAEYIEG